MGLIRQGCIDDILDRVDIVDVVRKFVEVKRVGANWVGLSPFKKEKSPSFSVSPAKQIFKCFASGEGGGVVQFLMLSQGMDFPGAMRWLADFAAVPLEYEEGDVPDADRAEARQELLGVNAAAARRYATVLHDLRADHPARVYVDGRFTQDEVVTWQIGYTGDDDAMIAGLCRERGLDAVGKRAGLVSEKHGKDFFRGRVMFPVVGLREEVLSFGGRALEGKPKYLNTTNTEVYDKGRVLFGLHRAARWMRKLGYVWLVEGYTDVIGLHSAGMGNVVATCGTALSEVHCAVLQLYCNHVIILRDGDGAGKKAAERDLRLLLKAGAKVEVGVLADGVDPFDMARAVMPVAAAADGEPVDDGAADEAAVAAFREVVQDGVLWYAGGLLYAADDDPVARGVAIRQVAELLNGLGDRVVRDGYVELLYSRLKVRKRDITEAMKGLVADRNMRLARRSGFEYKQDDYELPREAVARGCEWDAVKEDILAYGLFFWRHELWVKRGDSPTYHFDKVSNFEISIIQHMEDEKFPMKLVQIENIHGRRRTFDTANDSFLSVMNFKKMVTGKGNYNWSGRDTAFDKLVTKLMDEMGDGRMIVILGQQDEGFWAFNNAVVIPADGDDGDDLLKMEVVDLDEHGCFEFDGSSYYVPSGNEIYLRNPYKFSNQKRVQLLRSGFSFEVYLLQMVKVHREHAYNALLFAIGTAFSDLIYERVSFYPILFLYGEASTGKDNLIEACQAFFGKPQEALLLTGKANTDKGKIREMAQFRNMPAHFSEYKQDDDTDEMLKGMWDRKGYKRGTLDSMFGNESVPILSTVMMTGNYYPTNDALITRVVADEVMKNVFSVEEKAEYERLKEMVQGGVSGFLVEILGLRKRFEVDFRKRFKEVGNLLKGELASLPVADRMIQNMAVLGAIYKLAADVVPFPFSFDDWLTYTRLLMERQNRKRETGSVVQKFWDCFLEAVRDKHDPILPEREFKVDGNQLFINFGQVYGRYSKLHWGQFREAGLPKTVLQDKLKKSEAFVEIKSSQRFGPKMRSSAYEFVLDELPIAGDLMATMEYLEAERNKRAHRRAQEDNVDDSDDKEKELPF